MLKKLLLGLLGIFVLLLVFGIFKFRLLLLDLMPVPRLPENVLVTELRSELQKNQFSGAVMLSHGQRTIFAEAFGLSNRETKRPNTLTTRFHIASLSKMFTGTAILQLVQEGKVELSSSLGFYLPDYPNKKIGDQATIHQRLTHTCGTGDIFGPDFDQHRLEFRTLLDYVKVFGARDPDFTPGERFDYSNYGMILLGLVIERVSGESYYNYIQNHIYQPAEMLNSGSELEDQGIPNWAAPS